MAAVAMALAIGFLALIQWRAAASFGTDAIEIDARVVGLRTAKKTLIDPEAEIFAMVEFEVASGDIVRAELPTSIQTLGLDPTTLEGTTLGVSYDPSAASSVRYGGRTGAESALVLALLAIGALFVPRILRQMTLHGGGGG
jgi:hypothetical protein